MSFSEIVVAADGSALGNPGPAGWAWYVSDECWSAGGWEHGTNNMGELKAVLELLKATAQVPDQPLRILCDSRYTIDSLTKWIHGWKKKGWKKSDGKAVLNLELFKELDEAMKGRKYTFEWVKGHAGHPLNEAADERARGAATAYRDGRPPQTGPGFTLLNDSLDFSTPESKEEPAVLSSIISVAQKAEESLLRSEIYADEQELKKLLSPNFQWISPAGRLIDRSTVVQYREKAFLCEEEPEVLQVESLSEDFVRLLSIVQTARVRVMRTSLWQVQTTGCVLIFRQETALPPR